MALKKQFISENGITTEYHMIDSLNITDRVEIKLKSYTDEGYRNREKAIENNMILKAELEQQLFEESVKEEPDNSLIEKLNQEIESIHTTPKDYSVGFMNYKLPFSKEDDISYSSIYEKLKTETIFEDAEDC